MVLQLGVVDVSPVRLPAAASAPVGIHDAGATAVRPVSAAVPLVPAQDGADGSGGSGGGGCGSDGSPCGSGSDNNDSSSGSSGGTSDRKPEEESNADGSKPKSEPNGGQGSSAPATDSAADGSKKTETAAPVADGAKRTETPAPVAGGPRPTETPAPAADGARPTETPAPAADGAKRTDTPAPGADGARTTEPAAPAANGPKPTESAAPVADGTKRDEPVAPGDGAKTTPAPAPVDGARPNETALPVASVDGVKPTVVPADGVQECGAGQPGCPPKPQPIPSGQGSECVAGTEGCDNSSGLPEDLSFRDVGHGALDVAGLVPGVGEFADGLNALWYLGEGDTANAAVSGASLIPFAGWAATGGKWAKRGMDAVEAAEDGARAATRGTPGGPPSAEGGTVPGAGAAGKLPWTSWQNYPKVSRGGKDYAQIGDRLYSQHAVDRMQPRGLGQPFGAPSKVDSNGGVSEYGPGRSISPNFVEDVLRSGRKQPFSIKNEKGEMEERLKFESGTVTVITSKDESTVITIMTR